MNSPAQHSSIKYRRDIDGLRAVAVMCVVIYHLDANNLSGGFIGVDVFFVISGYLISSILFRELESESFTFSRFYERRVRRIAPALIAVLTIVSVAAFIFLFPFELTSYAESLIAAIASISNFYFLKHAGYFDQLGNTHPLLHTWSLAVEEQFYISFPVLLLLLRKYAWSWRKAFVTGMFFASFALSWLSVRAEPSRTFYMLDTRAWELLTGSLLSLSMFPTLRKKWICDALSICGVASVVGSAVLYKASTPFPGPAALVPCLGSALVIWAGQERESLAGRLLACGPLVFIGTISYSLYLIHWPLIVFTLMSRLCSVPQSNHLYYKMLKLGILGTSIGGAYLSYRFIEQPFRDKRVSRRMLFSASASFAVVLVVLAAGLISLKGLPNRFPAQAVAVSRYLEFDPKPAFREGACFITPQTTYSAYDQTECLQTDGKRPNYLLFGDSHAAQYWHEMSLAAPEINVLQATATGCKPFIEIKKRDYPDCQRLIQYIYKTFLIQHQLNAVIISARWSDEDLPSLKSSLMYLRSLGIRVILIGPSMEYAQPLPRLIAVALIDRSPSGIYSEQANEKFKLDSKMRTLALAEGVEYLSPIDTLCKFPRCDYITPSGAPLLFDHDHLSPEGSAAVLQVWKAEGKLK